ncbi:MAG: hypothetical protein PHG82_03130 [Candidatus Gracilibacteria bacterium]|nr:hypothetical protein [Candidatus Gracilibacteria bacterium]
MSEISRRDMLKIAGLGAVVSGEVKTSEDKFSLQNLAARVSLDDKEEHKNGVFGSMFGAGIIGLVVSSILLFMILKNPEYKQYFWHLTVFVAVIAFLLIKDSIDDDKKDFVVKALYDDLDYLKDAFAAKFDSRYDSVSFMVGNFFIDYSYKVGFRVAYFEDFDFLKDTNKEDAMALSVMYMLKVESLIMQYNQGNFTNKDSAILLLIVGKYYFIDNVLKNRKELRKAINKLLESSDVVYVNDMTYICVAK